MTKKKMKFGLFILLSLIGLTVGFFFAGYLNLLFSGGSMDDLSVLQPAKLLAGVMSDERQRMLTFCIEVVIEAGIAALIILNRKETFESDTTDITKGIKTPIAIGQGQHGTARWMTAAEKRSAFSVYRLDKQDKLYHDLLLAGRQDTKEVVKYTDEPEATKSDNDGKGPVETPESPKAAEHAPENQ